MLQEELSHSLFGAGLQFEQELLRGGIDCDKNIPFLEECMWDGAPVLMVSHGDRNGSRGFFL